MTTARESVLYDVNDFKVAALLTDVTTAPTYSSTKDVPGIAAVAMQPGIKSAELKGDAKVLARKGNVDRWTFSCTYGKVALDALVVFFGGAATDGTGKVTYSLPGVNTLPYFKASFSILNADVADAHVVAHKSQVTGGTVLDQSTDAFGQPKIDFESIPCISDDDLFVDIEFYDTATPLT